MNATLFVLAGFPITAAEALAALSGGVLALSIAILTVAWRGRVTRAREMPAAEARQRALEAQIAELARAGVELSGRVGGMAEQLNARQADMSRLLAERLDRVGARVGAELQSSAQTTGETLAKLNERLAVIDSAQARLAGMTQEVVSLRDILANKQTRGAFGQGRMEAIVRDGLPADAYDFQFTLGNKSRPDCVIRLPGDERPLVVDAKFPLEAFTLFKDARSEEAKKAAAARVRGDVVKHVKDIAERYLLPGETQDVALMFVPAESLYCDLVEQFDDIVQRAHRARVVIVSPSLLTIAIQIAQTLTRDARMRDAAHRIQDEMGKLVKDVRLLVERTEKLENHFRQAQDDIAQIATSTEKISRRALKIEAMDFDGESFSEAKAPVLRLAKGGE